MSNYEQEKTGLGGQLIGEVRGQKKRGRKEDGEGVEVVGGAEEDGAIVEEEFYQLKVRRRWGRVKRERWRVCVLAMFDCRFAFRRSLLFTSLPLQAYYFTSLSHLETKMVP